MSKYYVGEEYKVDPGSVEFNDEYVEFNPLHNEAEYISTKLSIEEQGQLKPVFMLEGKCVDGRHRTKIATELGIKLLAIDLDPGLDKGAIYDLCNIDTISGRNLTSTQRAIAALDYMERLGVQQQDVAKKFQVPRQSVMYAYKLKNVYRQKEAVKILHNGGAVLLGNMDKPSKSLEFVCKKAKELYEASVVEDTSERVQFSPDASIRTEVGKVWYYSFVNNRNLDVETRMYLVELANYKFREIGS